MTNHIYRGFAKEEVFDEHRNLASVLFICDPKGSHAIARADHLDVVFQRAELEVEVAAERDRQDRKWGAQRCHPPDRWIVILGEEFGEVCEARNDHDTAGYRAELIQVAAVALAAIEALDNHGMAI